MFGSGGTTGLQKTTGHRVVVPFYVYGALSFLLAAGLLLASTEAAGEHYFHPPTLAITHLMALGWGTMIILGASHQLVPVLIEGRLYSEKLAGASFVLAAVGIPLLVVGFYTFHTGWPMQWGGILVNAAVLCYLVNVAGSIREKKTRDVYAYFILGATLWLLATTGFGLLLVYNFSYSFLSKDSLAYLSIHAHMGLAGWFLLLVVGVGSRLIPMFLVSKYVNKGRLWTIFALLNTGLLGFITLKSQPGAGASSYTPFVLVAVGLGLFVHYCSRAYRERIRKQVDDPMKISLLSVALLALPILSLLVVILFVSREPRSNMVLLYGFCIFFGWITAIILGMTFKTLPFIIWNKVYHHKSGSGKSPALKDLFSDRLVRWMGISYLAGFSIFIVGLIVLNDYLLKAGAAALLASAVFYVWNVGIVVFHQPRNV
ncbi:MAG TPA: cytochrome C oxidase subunit I [Chitinophagaceae bacterium]